MPHDWVYLADLHLQLPVLLVVAWNSQQDPMQPGAKSSRRLFAALAAVAALAIIAAYNLGTRVRTHGVLPDPQVGSSPTSATASGDPHPIERPRETEPRAPGGNGIPAVEGNNPQPGAATEQPQKGVSPQTFEQKYGSMTLDQLVEARTSSERVLHKKCEEILNGMLDRGEYEERILSAGEKAPPVPTGLAYAERVESLPGGQTLVHSATIDHSTHTDTAALYAEMIWLGQEVDSRRSLAGKPPK